MVRFEKVLHKQRLFFKTIILRTNSPMLFSNWIFCPITPFKVVRCQPIHMWKMPSQTGSIFLTWSFWVQPYAIFKLNVLSHNSIPSCQTWNIPSQMWIVIGTIVLSTDSPMLYSNCIFCPITSFQVVRFETFLYKQGLFLDDFWVPTVLCYLHNWMFCPITLFEVVRFETFLHVMYGSILYMECLGVFYCVYLLKYCNTQLLIFRFSFLCNT